MNLTMSNTITGTQQTFINQSLVKQKGASLTFKTYIVKDFTESLVI